MWISSFWEGFCWWLVGCWVSSLVRFIIRAKIGLLAVWLLVLASAKAKVSKAGTHVRPSRLQLVVGVFLSQDQTSVSSYHHVNIDAKVTRRSRRPETASVLQESFPKNIAAPSWVGEKLKHPTNKKNTYFITHPLKWSSRGTHDLILYEAHIKGMATMILIVSRPINDPIIPAKSPSKFTIV